MREKFICPKCGVEMKFEDLNGKLRMCCPICESSRILDYPENWEEVKHEYLED